MPDNPFAQYKKPNPFAVYKTQGAGPKPPANFAPVGTQVAPLHYIPGSADDPAVIAQQAAARQAPEIAGQSRLIQQRMAAGVEEERQKNQLPINRNAMFDNVGNLRKELEGQLAVRQYKGALPSYAAALQSPNTPAGDQDLIYAFAKIMDPTSVVMEGEKKGVEDLGTVGQKIAGQLQKQLGEGGSFTSDLRTQLRNTLASRVGAYNKGYNFERSRFTDLSTKQGIDPDLVVGKHMGDAYATVENQYFRHDPNKSAAVARAEAAQAAAGGGNSGGADGGSPAVLPGATPATGDTHSEQMDPKTAAIITSMIGNHMTADEMNRILVPAKLIGPQGFKQEDIDKYQKTLAAGGSLAPAYEAPNSLLNKAASSPVGVGIGAAADAGLAGLTDEATGVGQWMQGKGNLSDLIGAANQKKQAAFSADPKAALIGNIAGSGAAMLTGGALADAARVPGLTRMFAGRAAQRALPLAGDMAYGAAYGAGDNNDNRALGALIGAGSAGVGHAVGGRIVNAAGGVLTGVRNGAVRYLDAAGIPMTGGQMLGGTMKGIEDKLTSIPFVGDVIKNRRAEGYNAFNQAAFNEAGQPINAAVQGVGDAGLANLDQATGQAYGRALDGVNVNGNDPAFMGDMSNVVARAQNLPEPMAGNADYTLRTRIGQSFDNNGNMTGNDFQQAVRGLRRDSRAVAPMPYGHDFGQIAQGGESALEGLLQRQAPGTLPAYRDANSAFRHQSVLDDTINGPAKNQINEDGSVIFTPAQLNSTSVRNERMFGGQRPFQQLAQAGQQVLPSKIPDSGTAGRAALGLLAATAGGGAIGGAGGAGVGEADKGGGVGAGLGLMAGMLNTRAGQRALTALLLRRPQVAEDAGNWLVQQEPLGRHLGAAFGATNTGPAVTGWLTR